MLDFLTQHLHSSTVMCKFLVPMALFRFLILCVVVFHTVNGQTKQKSTDDDRIKDVLKYMNPNVDPCDDFYEYACGNFKKEHPLTSDNTMLVDNFTLLKDWLVKKLAEILEERDSPDDPVAIRKARSIYQACVDEDFVKTQTMTYPEKSIMEDVGGFPLTQWQPQATKLNFKRIGELAADYGIPLLFSVQSYYDSFDASKMVVLLSVDPMAVPEQLRSEDSSYEDIIEKDFLNLRILKRTKTVSSLEVLLRKISQKINKMPAVGYQIPEDIIYSRLDNVTNFIRGIYFGGVVPDGFSVDPLKPLQTLDELNAWTQKYFPDIELDWIAYLNSVYKNSGVTLNGSVTVMMSASLTGGAHNNLYGILNWYKMSEAWVVNSMIFLRLALFLAPDSDLETREAFHDYLKTKKTPVLERWEYCARKIADASDLASFSFALTYEFQKSHYDKEKLNTATKMVLDIKQSFIQIIQDTEWLDDSSKEAALVKLNNTKILLAHPDFAADKQLVDMFYENVRVCKWDNYGNAKRLRAFRRAYQLAQFARRNRTIWEKSPLDVNAYYSRPTNKITLPIAILHPIFFGTEERILDYSRLGSIIGHEITHGFDGQGRKYDPEGVLRNWWTNETVQNFNNRTDCFVKQYSGYDIPEIGASVNGVTTLDENLADNGGTRTSYRAVTRFLKKVMGNYKGTARQYTKNYTVDQLFFIGFASMWCSNESESYLQQNQQCTSGCHSRSKWRVNGVLSNMEEFSTAFKCPLGRSMNPERKCKLW